MLLEFKPPTRFHSSTLSNTDDVARRHTQSREARAQDARAVKMRAAMTPRASLASMRTESARATATTARSLAPRRVVVGRISSRVSTVRSRVVGVAVSRIDGSVGEKRVARGWRRRGGEPALTTTRAAAASGTRTRGAEARPELYALDASWDPMTSGDRRLTSEETSTPMPTELPDVAGGASAEDAYDLVIVGCGPAGLSAADEASRRGMRVALIDPSPLTPWLNNYGVWCDEFKALGFDDCYRAVWNKARVIIDETDVEGKMLDRAYAQVDRKKLKAKLFARTLKQGVEFGAAAVESCDNSSSSHSIVTLSDGRKVFAKMVLDATGHSRKLVEFDRDFTPGYQAAFGIVATVEKHPFPLDTMLFMDWRDEHLSPKFKEQNDRLPTFLYAMPFSETEVFLEETSLVARPGLDFDDLKLKLKERLDHLGVKVTAVHEEEYCLIPMGGVLPTFPQRTLGIGGTAGMVHPSTGFMVAKTMLCVRTLVGTLDDALKAGVRGDMTAALEAAEAAQSENGEFDANATAEVVWKSIWSESDLRMRTFMCFGMETLMELDINGTRQFFDTFFDLPKDVWAGFLSWRIKPAGLLSLGVQLFVLFSNYMRLTFVKSALPFMGSFFANFAFAENKFDSNKWGGYLLEDTSTVTNAGNGPIPAPMGNPTAKPITGSALNFADILEDEKLSTPKNMKPSDIKDDREWIAFQQRKVFNDQKPIKDYLGALSNGDKVDVLVVGAGPAGLAIAAETAKRGVSVGLIAPDTPFVNNYGVWLDEFQKLGLEHCLLHKYEDALVWFDDSDPAAGNSLGRPYGQVCRKRLRDHLLNECAAAGVKYMPGLVDFVRHGDTGKKELAEVRGTLINDAPKSEEKKLIEEEIPKQGVKFTLNSRLVVAGTGHNREMLSYEEGSPPGWQTAYGVEVRIPNHGFPVNKAIFMDFRQSDPEVGKAEQDEGLWRVPSFLYVLPVNEDVVFVEETCLVARVQVPFDELKRRLYRRMTRMGMDIVEEDILEIEASWIPLGGTPPVAPQRTIAYGAAAGMVHPASGYSVVNSIRNAPQVAEAMVSGLKEGGEIEASRRAWEILWGAEKRRQIGFYQFGMELLMSLRIEQMRNFFSTFFALPTNLSRGFLGNDLSSSDLILFALTTFAIGNNELRGLLLAHLVSAGGSGSRLAKAYAYGFLPKDESGLDLLQVDRRDPSRERNTTKMMADFYESQKGGMTPGYMGKDWWSIGKRQSKSIGDDDEGMGGGSAGGSDGSSSIPSSTDEQLSVGAMKVNAMSEGSVTYWSDGSAAMIVTNAVRSTGLKSDDLYGDSRKMFLPTAFISNVPNVVPPHLTGSLPGDIGWDPLALGAQSDIQRYRARELIHGRWAMLATIGVLVPEFLAHNSIFGTPDQHWWNTQIIHDPIDGFQLTYLGETIPWGLFWLPIIHLPLMFVAESLRNGTYEVEAFKHLDKLYPGGALFDPLGLAAGQTEEDLKVLKTIEIQHARLAMVATFVFIIEALAGGHGPLDFTP